MVFLFLRLGRSFLGFGLRCLISFGGGSLLDILNQRRAQFGGLARVFDLQAQGQAPALGFRVVAHVVFYQLGVVTHADLAAHGGVFRQGLEGRALEVHQVGNATVGLADQVGLLDVTGRTQGLLGPGAIGRVQGRFVHGPVQAIGEIEWLERLWQGVRAPERNDVVVGFVSGRNFYQVNRAFAPVALRFDPGAWALMVVVVQVFVVAEVATTLQQAKATRVFNREVAHRQVFRVVQRAPDPLAVAGMNRQARAIVQLATVVEDFGRLVGAEQVHAGQRSDAQLAHFVTQEHLRLDVHHRVHARAQGKAVSTGRPWRIQQGEDHQVLVVWLGFFDPEFGEARELFARRQCGVDRHTTGRQAIDLALAHNAEITRAEHGHDFVLLIRLVDRIQHAETSPTEVFGGFRVKLDVAEIETARVVLDLFNRGGGHFVDFHRRVEMHALVIEGQFERGFITRPLGLVTVELDFLVVRELHVAEFLWQIAARRLVLLLGEGFSLSRHVIQTECPQLTRTEQAKERRARHQCVTQPLGRHFWCI